MKILGWLLVLTVLSPGSIFAGLVQHSALEGSLKALGGYLDRTRGRQEEGVLASQRLRFDYRAQVVEQFELDISVEQQLLWSDPPAFVGLARDSANRVLDWEKSWNRAGRFESQLQLDRLSLHGELAEMQWSIGRQAIGFGRISLFSPLDVIAPFPPDAIDVDVRPGVDALKITHYFGLVGQLGGVIVLGETPQSNSYLLTFEENVANFDLLLMLGSLRDRPLLGLGLAGEVGELGLKAEVNWYRGQRVGISGGDLRDEYVIAALEGWYRFNNGLVLLAEYLYNGAGANKPQQYPLVAASGPLQEGLSFLLGRHYLLVGPAYELHPLVTINGLLIQNLQDSSSLVRPLISLSLADNLQLDLFWAFALGEKPQADTVFGLELPKSEFGSAADTGGALLRWYF